MGSALPPPQPFSRLPEPSSIVPQPIFHVIITAASLRLGHILRLQLSAGSLHHSSFKRVHHLFASDRTLALKGIGVLGICKDALESSCSLCMSFFYGGLSRNDPGDDNSMVEPSRRKSSIRRNWTNVLLAINVLAYVAQVATHGKLLLWGAKINSLIDKGQIWRLVTSSLLHANVGHLLVNCFSLNSVGPTVENISGPRRYLAIYLTSAIASTATSYWLCKAPTVGASGAIFGLVGSVAVFTIRHRSLVKDSDEDLQRIAQVILLNMAIGVMSRGIDNWGHLGGLIGGVAMSWLLGPAWKYDSMSMDGRRVFTDRAPIFLFRRETETRRNR